jgi:hypothetical protein
MQNFRCLPLVMCLALISVGVMLAQEAKPLSAIDEEESHQTLIEIKPDRPDPFVLNEALAKELMQANHKIAMQKLSKIKDDMAELITKYPDTKAGKEAAEILDKAGFKVIPGYGVHPKGVFVSSVPLLR